MTKNLVIVESPAKAKTIEKILGKDFTVKSSFGHIRDLPKKGTSIDIENGFQPTYEIPADKKKVVAELRKAAKASDTVWLASDEDREGEAIAWHLAQALKLDLKTTKRIVFHEITKSAIEAAVQNPRTININLVNAQQARRVLDRLVGYNLSPVLWKKVQPGLSAGRVQSVAVRLIVEREREIAAFESIITYKTTATFKTESGHELPAELSERLSTEDAARSILLKAANKNGAVSSVELKPGTRNPSAPFTTSTLQQEAARKLGYSVKQTMTLAQRLYENGHITYMRTDSTNLSGLAINAIKEYVTKVYGQHYHQVRQYKTKNSSAQEAHEAIRPSYVDKTEAGADEQQKKLYKLIWQRAVASQMTAAKLDKTEVAVTIEGITKPFVAKGEIISFDGFFKVYGGTKDDVILPDVKKGDVLDIAHIQSEQNYSKGPARYTEATLVRTLEEMGIGRPSTYAPTISTIQTRGYVERADLEGTKRTIKTLQLKGNAVIDKTDTVITGADKNKLLPTYLATVTTDFLTKHFASIVDYDFTAKAEAHFDDVEEGRTEWQNYIAQFYKSFKPLLDKSDDISRQETSQARILGTDPKSGKPLMARYGRYGPMLQIGEAEDEDKPKFAPMPEGSKIETITFEQAMEMFKLPRTVGTTADGQEIKANIGRFGPYIQVGKLYVSIKPLDPLSIDEKKARELYEGKLLSEKEKHIATFDNGLQIIKGPYGPYITDGKKNARIPKGVEPKDLTAEQCKELIDAAPDKKKRFVRKRRKA